MRIINTIVPFLACAAACLAQNYCPAGVPPDGFVDWTKLPASGSGTGSFSHTIPVSGVSGLNLTISAPAAQSYGVLNYQASNSTRLLLAGGVRDVTLAFSKPIRGLRLVAETTGRFDQSFSMKAIQTGGSVLVPNFSTATSQYNHSPSQNTLTPLEVEDVSASIQSVVFSFNGDQDEYQSFAINNLRIDSGAQRDPALTVPTQGLRQWFRADKGVIFGDELETRVTGWADVSPGGSAGAVSDFAASQPFFVPEDGAHCQPALAFDGTKSMKAPLAINGWDQMTIFLVSKSTADDSDGSYHSLHPALSWAETGSWGMTYLSPFQTHLAFRFGTGQAFNYPEVNRGTNIGGDFTVTTAIHAATVDSVYVNGRQIANVTGRHSTLSNVGGEEFLGNGSQGTFFKGEIGEVLIYDRTLTDAERHSVELYLTNKYGTF